MLPQLVDQWLAQLQTLPTRDQVAALLIAAKRCESISTAWFDSQKLGPAARGYTACLERWLAGQASDKALEKAARPLDRHLNREIEYEQDLSGAMVAHALLDTEAVALGYSPEMLDEILRTSVFFSAAAFTHSSNVPVEVDTDRLSPAELQFIQEWWEECIRRFPALRS